MIRVATDYQGTWVGEYVVRRCDESGDFRDIDFCDREDGFYVGGVLELGFDLRQDRDEVNGDIALGGLQGTTGGRVEANGRFAGTGSLTFTEDGLAVVFAVNPLDVNADGDRMTGTFTVTVTAVGLSGQGVLQAELTTVVRTASGMLPTGSLPTHGRSLSAGGVKGLVNLLRRWR